jgi:hypothetical protein
LTRSNLALPDTTIAEAQCHGALYPSGEFDPSGRTPSVPSDFCRVAGIIAPTGDSAIAFEVWMPPQTAWNGRFMGVGNGAFAGVWLGPYEIAAQIRVGGMGKVYRATDTKLDRDVVV